MIISFITQCTHKGVFLFIVSCSILIIIIWYVLLMIKMVTLHKCVMLAKTSPFVSSKDTGFLSSNILHK